MKKVKVIHKKLWHFGGRNYRVDGLADTDKNVIFIDVRLKGYSHLLTFVHEFYHIHNPDWSETEVKRKSSELARALYKHGYRLQK
jgi:hypothetical protein